MASCPECSREYDESVKVCPEDGAILTSSGLKGDAFLGRIIDEKYKILERLGDGGMGSVYKAEHLLMGRTVALKVLRRSLADDGEKDEFVRRFQAEARTASRISHPNAVTIHDFGLDGNDPYLVMEFNEGRSLKAILAEDGPLDITRVVSILSQVCEAIDEAHSHGIVHRDLKPDNIMISSKRDGSDFAQVLDFGIAKILGGGGKDTQLTKTGSVIGTPRYMSPEQVVSGEVDSRSDIYSLGVILYEMISGEVPFDADSAMQLMIKQINERPVPVREFKPELNIPQAIEVLLAKALEKEPLKRQQSVMEFLSELRAGSGLDSGYFRSISGSGSFGSPEIKRELEKPLALSASSKGSSRFASATMFAVSLVVVLSVGAGYYLYSGFGGGGLKNTASSGLQVASMGDSTADSSGESLPISDEQKALNLASANELIGRGVVEIESENFQQAASLFEQALTLNPDDSATYRKLAACYTKLEQYEEAEKNYRLALERTPDDAKTKVLLGFTLKNLDRIEEAKAEFAAASELDPELSVAKVQLAALSGDGTARGSLGLTIEDLIVQLGSDKRDTRVTAAKHLEEFGAEAVPMLIQSLKSRDSRVRYWSAAVLGRLKATDAVSPLILALQDPSGVVVDSATRSLRMIGTPQAIDAAVKSEAKQRLRRQRDYAERQKRQGSTKGQAKGSFFDNFWRSSR